MIPLFKTITAEVNFVVENQGDEDEEVMDMEANTNGNNEVNKDGMRIFVENFCREFKLLRKIIFRFTPRQLRKCRTILRRNNHRSRRITSLYRT